MEVIKDLLRLQEVLARYQKIVVLGGAGTSTESGVPDFRSATGLYNQPHKFSPEKILSHNFFFNQPEIFYDFYKEHIISKDPRPHIGHQILAKWEQKGIITKIITQNIDGLHQLAGSNNVIELHGSVLTNHCVKCHKAFDLDYIKQHTGVIRCDNCNGLVKPDVILYNEPLDEHKISEAIHAILEADLLMIIGTSLNVYPAAGLIDFASKTLLLNESRTSRDIDCDYVYYGPFGKTLEQLASVID